jgi:hypothetical protein
LEVNKIRDEMKEKFLKFISEDKKGDFDVY